MMTSEELKAFVRKNPISVGCGVLALGLAAAIFVRSGEMPAAEEVLTTATAQADRYALNVKYSAQLKEHVNLLAAANKEIDSRLVRASQLGTNTQFFYKLQSDTGVKLLDFRQSSLTPAAKAAAEKAGKAGKSGFVPVGFTVSVQGTLPQVLNFLRQLETGPHYCRVESANFSANPALRGGPLTLSLIVELLGLP